MNEAHDPDTGVTEQEWLARRIELHYLQHGVFNTGLCLEYAQKFGVQAEKNLINAISIQGA